MIKAALSAFNNRILGACCKSQASRSSSMRKGIALPFYFQVKQQKINLRFPFFGRSGEVVKHQARKKYTTISQRHILCQFRLARDLVLYDTHYNIFSMIIQESVFS